MWCAVAEVAAPVNEEPHFKRTPPILLGDVDISSSDSEQEALDESDPNHSSDENHSVFPAQPPPSPQPPPFMYAADVYQFRSRDAKQGPFISAQKI